jgi:hypothetical protein
MAPTRCKVCGTANATCGVPTVHRIVAVDEVIQGKVIGDMVVRDDAPVFGTDGMNSEEREEFVLLSAQYERRRLRNQMAEGARGYTHLAYVRGANGQIVKMSKAAAERYIELNDGAEIVDQGTRDEPEEGEVIGATKARVGAMFDDNGRQLASVQPMTTTTFLAHDGIRDEVHTPALGAAGAEKDNPAGGVTPSGGRRIARSRGAEHDVTTSGEPAKQD